MPKRTPLILAVATFIDVAMSPFTWVAAIWMRILRRMGMQYMPCSKRILLAVGVLPIRDHYYEPLINSAHLHKPLSEPRFLPGLDFNDAEQLKLLSLFRFQAELLEFPLEPTGDELMFHYHNRSFASGDAEYLYSLLRVIKPTRIIEIGCGHSTLVMQAAVARNHLYDPGYACDHVCIEPYEQPWLEKLSVTVVRRKVEELDLSIYDVLQAGDVLFIDSSHVIRPQGDVEHEYLRILPILKPGVFVHVHDIFTPHDYLREWIVDEIKLWNEQYLLEAFLSMNPSFRIIGALNYLKHRYPTEVAGCFPILKREFQGREPGSFWMVRQ